MDRIFYYLLVASSLRFYLFDYAPLSSNIWRLVSLHLNQVIVDTANPYAITAYTFINCTFCTGGQVGFWIYLTYLMDWSILGKHQFYYQLPEFVAFALASAMFSLLTTKALK
jgi:hypothetical protein